MTGPITLADYATISNNPLLFAVVMSLLRNGSVLDDLPLVTKSSMVVNSSRVTGGLQAPNWSPIGGVAQTIRHAASPFSEQVYIVRDAINVDRVLMMDENAFEDPRAFNLRVYLESLRYDINDKFINNDHTVGNANSMVGIRSRIDNPSTYGVNSDMKIDAGAVDMSTATMTKSSALAFFEYINQLLSYMGTDDGSGIVLYINDLMERRLVTAVSQLGAGAGFSTSKDALGRRVLNYREAKIVNLGRKSDQSSRVITSTETASGANGASVHTSIYGVRYGQGQFMGWQMSPFSVIDFGLVSGQSYYSTLVEWVFGVAQFHTRSIGRIHGIKVN